MTTHYAATKTRDGPEPDADWIYELDAPLDRDEAGWLVGLCSLAPLVDPAEPEWDAADDDRADDGVCADAAPEVPRAPSGTV